MSDSVVSGSLKSPGQSLLRGHPDYIVQRLGQLVPSSVYLPYFLVAGTSIKYVRLDRLKDRIQLIFNCLILTLI